MNKCSVKVLCKNEYLTRMTVMLLEELGFLACSSDLPDGDINIIDSSFHVRGACDYTRVIYVCENGERIPKGIFTVLSKPFLHKELKATVLSLYNRLYASAAERIIFEKDKLVYKGESIQLTEKEAELFSYLYSKAETPVSREELLEKIWAGEASAEANVTDVYISYIRKKTRKAFGIDTIRSVRGVGYMYSDEYTVSLK